MDRFSEILCTKSPLLFHKGGYGFGWKFVNGLMEMEAPGGLEPPIEILQTSALPLGDGALLGYYGEKNGAGEGVRTLDFNLGKVALYH